MGSGGTGLFLVNLVLGVGLWLGVRLVLVDLLPVAEVSAFDAEAFAFSVEVSEEVFAADVDVSALVLFAGFAFFSVTGLDPLLVLLLLLLLDEFVDKGVSSTFLLLTAGLAPALLLSDADSDPWLALV